MIHDSLANLHTYKALHPLFGPVLEFISAVKMVDLEKGRIQLSRGVYAIVDEYETKDRNGAFLECHRSHIDIQIILEGAERIGICHKNEARVSEAYSEEGDFEKLDGPVDLITLREGYFALFYPQDGHLPALKISDKKERVRKIVFKIPY